MCSQTCYRPAINSLDPGRWISLDLNDEMSTLVQLMARCTSNVGVCALITFKIIKMYHIRWYIEMPGEICALCAIIWHQLCWKRGAVIMIVIIHTPVTDLTIQTELWHYAIYKKKCIYYVKIAIWCNIYVIIISWVKFSRGLLWFYLHINSLMSGISHLLFQFISPCTKLQQNYGWQIINAILSMKTGYFW